MLKPPEGVARVLMQARDLIADENNWCRGVLAHKRADGGMQYCALGAVGMAARGDCHGAWAQGGLRAIDALEKASWELFGETFHGDVAITNNDGGHAVAMQMFDRAIANTMKETVAAG